MKDQLIFDTTEVADSDNVGAYIRSSDGTLITHTTDGSREALDVYTELGIAESSAHVSGDIGAAVWGVRNDAGTPLAADGEYIPLSMDSTGALRVNASVNVDSNSDYAEDSAHSSGDVGEFGLSIRLDDLTVDNSALLAGTNGDYQGTFTNAKGEMWVKDSDVQSAILDITHDEDSVHVSGDKGIMGLAVRNDAGTPLAADGDYIPLTVGDDGALYTRITQSVPFTIDDAALANTAIASNVNTLAVANTAEDVVAAPLADRKYLYIYNNDNKKLFIGQSGVTAANGFPISPGSYIELRAGAAIDIEWVSSKVGHDMRHLELS